MRAFYFMKIDYIRARKQICLILPMLVFVTMVLKFTTDGPDSTIFLYGVFIAIVFSTVSFGNCSRADSGFLQLLPATTGQRVLGRFLFGLSMLSAVGGISIGCIMLYRLIMGTGITGISMAALPVYMAAWAVGLVIITVQYIFLYLVGESRGAQAMPIVRTVPGMCFFFGFIKLTGEINKNPDGVMRVIRLLDGRWEMAGWCCVLAALAMMMVAIILCTKVTEKKDY